MCLRRAWGAGRMARTGYDIDTTVHYPACSRAEDRAGLGPSPGNVDGCRESPA